jgi:hypothetical protein
MMFFIVLGLLLIIGATIIGIRNCLVYNFLTSINHKGYNICTSFLDAIPDEGFTQENQKYYEHLQQTWEDIYNSLSYYKIVFSFWKPLNYETWLTKEQINFLNLKF